jgi:protein ImuB
VGDSHLGMLAALPEKELISRMGQSGKRLRQMARGEMPHLFQPVEPAFTLEERMELDSPIEILDTLMFVVNVMLEQLVLRATARVLALASCQHHADARRRRYAFPLCPACAPTNDRQLWIKLLHLDLEAHPPQAAILGGARGRAGQHQQGATRLVLSAVAGALRASMSRWRASAPSSAMRM